MPSNIFSRILAREPWVMMAMSWVWVNPAIRLRTYSAPRIVTMPRIAPEAADQSPLWKVSSTTARTFCMNTEGMALMIASKIIQTMAIGSSTG